MEYQTDMFISLKLMLIPFLDQTINWLLSKIFLNQDNLPVQKLLQSKVQNDKLKNSEFLVLIENFLK